MKDFPITGGDTWFANLAAAYDALPATLKRSIASLRAVHSNVHIYGKEGYYRGTDIAKQLGGADSVGEATHPVVIRHPESGSTWHFAQNDYQGEARLMHRITLAGSPLAGN